MRAVTLRRPGPPDSLRVEEAPEPHPGPGEVLIQVQAAGVNFTDVLSRQGLNPEAPPRPYVLGHETSGDVAALGEGVDRFRVGQRVLSYHMTGGYAERIAVPAEQVIAIPDSLAYQCAATLPLNYGTAYVALYRTGPVERGMRIFIHAAAGGVGMAAVDLARRAGLEMTGAAGTHFKRARLLSEGVKHVVQSRHLHIARLGQRIYGGRAYDIVLDSVGGPSIRDGLKSLRPGGRVVSLGVSGLSGKGVLGALSYLLRAPRFTFIDLLRPSLGLHGVNLRELIRNRELMRKVLEELVSLADLGEITPQPGRVMGLAEAGEAHRLLQSRANVGKIVLRM
ncbi:MAG TPA: zinc-binding dehydrogenase [Candidatus Omnitrophota bacterium]|jgi:NADPH:quinone reductase-like Zn-dependent oxidoreductase|nr:zinc-binding dehydrogenase [Candidatus Omnitrophota bacterium]